MRRRERKKEEREGRREVKKKKEKIAEGERGDRERETANLANLPQNIGINGVW